jgi:hypothetical protein
VKIYFSGNRGRVVIPEMLIPDFRPYVMLTFYEIEKKDKGTARRLELLLKKKKAV